MTDLQTKNDFETFFQTMPVPRMVIREKAGREFSVAHVNDIALKYFDLQREQIEGHKIQDFMDAENALHFQQSLEVCSSKKKAVTIQAIPGVPGQVRVLSFFITPILNDAGDIEFLDIIGQIDVADQSALQRERDDALSLLTSIFEVSEVGIIVTDYTGRIVRVNESFIRTYGWARDELINADVTSIATPDERDNLRKNHEEYIRSGARSTGELKIIRKNGSIANALFTTATMELSQRRRFQVTTVMDITLRKQMEESLRRAKEQADTANRAKSTFLANMSHELRTPLNAILGFSEMIIKETFGKIGHPKYKEYLGDVHSSAEHLLDIINEVLDMSKIEAERIELDEQKVDVPVLIQSVTRMLASRAFSNDIAINVEIHEDLPGLLADPRLIRQVLINLVTNAVKFSTAGGEVDVKAETSDDGCIQIIIKDSGIGIPKDKIKQALEPFGQVSERVENAEYQGTGLGLPLAKAMIDLHDGELSLDSDVGQGTRVLVRFPAYRMIDRATPNPHYSNKDAADLAVDAKDA